MITRLLVETDLERVRAICKRHYDINEPDFSKFISVVVITQDDGQILGFGGVELLPEATIFMNKDAPALSRGKALKKLLIVAETSCILGQHSHLHAFVDSEDETWIRALESYAFKEVKQKVLILRVDQDG